MKDYDFTLKISDLLNAPWTIDTLVLSNKFSTFLPHLVDKWISTTIEMTWLSNEEVSLVFNWIFATLSSSCDRCWQECRHTVKIKQSQCKWVIWEENQKEDTIAINNRTKTVSIENYLVEIINVALPVVILCKDCQKKEIEINDENTDINPIQRK